MYRIAPIAIVVDEMRFFEQVGFMVVIDLALYIMNFVSPKMNNRLHDRGTMVIEVWIRGSRSLCCLTPHIIRKVVDQGTRLSSKWKEAHRI